MSAVEEIEAAIAKLTAERDAAEDGPWMQVEGDVVMGDPSDYPDAWPVIAESTGAEARLIVTLHRTIDAQLATLRVALGHMPFAALHPVVEHEWLGKRPGVRLALQLARAINGVPA